MGSKVYARFIDLVQRWPIDKARTGKDLGEHIRKLVAKEFPQGAVSRVNSTDLGIQVDSLNRLAGNFHRNNHPRKFPSSSVLGFELEVLREATSNEGFAQISDDFDKRTPLESEE